jgi:hypothetical protein
MFNGVANFIDTTTAAGVDVFGKWMDDLPTYWKICYGRDPRAWRRPEFPDAA